MVPAVRLLTRVSDVAQEQEQGQNSSDTASGRVFSSAGHILHAYQDSYLLPRLQNAPRVDRTAGVQCARDRTDGSAPLESMRIIGGRETA
jgi:hypothetical protein